METKNVKVEKATTSHHEEESGSEDSDGSDGDEWEETTMVVTVNGILDADMVREAISKNLVKLRYAETDAPVLQLNNSLYTASWTKDLGTNIVLQTSEKDQLEVIACGSTVLQAEKALLTSVKKAESSIVSQADSVPHSSLSRTNTRGK